MRFPRYLMLLAVPALLAGCTLFPKEEEYKAPVLQEPPPSRTPTEKVTQGYIAEEIKGLGRVAPVKETELYFTRAGRLKVMNAIVQQRVTAGKVLAQLEIGDLEHELKLNKIALEEARLKLSREEERARIEGRPLDNPDLDAFRLALERAQESVDYTQEKIDSSTIKAPYDGIITRIYTQAGLQVKEYDRIATIADPSQLQIQMELYSEDDFRRVSPGQRVKVEITKGSWVEGEITQLPTYAERNASGAERDRRVRIEVKNPGVKVNMNDMMTAIIVVQEKNDALKIPKSALREFMGRSYVRVMDGETRKEIDVEVGIRSTTEVEVLKGLTKGQEVICK